MRMPPRLSVVRRPVQPAPSRALEGLYGQDRPIATIMPYLEMFRAGMSPEGRPAGVFLLLGPTGTGKTKTVEAIAEMLHGNVKSLVRIDCGEFQLEHEAAKLIGAPPGYLGHRETQPILTQQKLTSATSEQSNLSLVLFDEIEKAAPSIVRLLLGVLDKGMLRLGDNNTVNFERSMIFFTSNLGARRIEQLARQSFGFAPPSSDALEDYAAIERAAMPAVKKHFPPEFVNRVDVICTYTQLSADALAAILDAQLAELQRHLDYRLGLRSFALCVTPAAKRLLLRLGTSDEYGARELKRVILRLLTQPLSSLITSGQTQPGARVVADAAASGDTLRFTVQG